MQNDPLQMIPKKFKYKQEMILAQSPKTLSNSNIKADSALKMWYLQCDTCENPFVSFLISCTPTQPMNFPFQRRQRASLSEGTCRKNGMVGGGPIYCNHIAFILQTVFLWFTKVYLSDHVSWSFLFGECCGKNGIVGGDPYTVTMSLILPTVFLWISGVYFWDLINYICLSGRTCRKNGMVEGGPIYIQPTMCTYNRN